jgi:hypothetical protein
MLIYKASLPDEAIPNTWLVTHMVSLVDQPDSSSYHLWLAWPYRIKAKSGRQRLRGMQGVEHPFLGRGWAVENKAPHAVDTVMPNNHHQANAAICQAYSELKLETLNISQDHHRLILSTIQRLNAQSKWFTP